MAKQRVSASKKKIGPPPAPPTTAAQSQSDLPQQLPPIVVAEISGGAAAASIIEDNKGRKASNPSGKDNLGAVIGGSTTNTSVGPTTPTPTLLEDEMLEDESQGGEENEGSQISALDSKMENVEVKNVDSNEGLGRKDQFRKYLTKTGFKYAIIRAFVALYEDSDKPDEPLHYLMGFVGHGIPTSAELEKFRTEAKEIREKIEKLQQENFELRKKIDERANLEPEDSLADQELKKMIQELTESGALAPTILTSAMVDDPV